MKEMYFTGIVVHGVYKVVTWSSFGVCSDIREVHGCFTTVSQHCIRTSDGS